MNKFFFHVFLSFCCVITLKLNAQTFQGSTGIISDVPNPTQTTFTAVVSGLTGPLTAAHGLAQVCLNITHPVTADLEIYLVAPNGTRRGLVLNKAGSGFQNTCFNLTSTDTITKATSPHTGTFFPSQSFSCWNNIGLSGNGTWRLIIRNENDDYSYPGNLNSWRITFGPTVGVGCGGTAAAADICNNATEICTFDGYCGNTTSCYAPDITGSNIDSMFAASCLPTAVEIHNNSWLTFVANDPKVDLEIDVGNCQNTNSNDRGIQLLITSTKDCKKFEGNYGCYPQIYGKRILNITGLTKGNKYYVMIDGAFGDVCDYKIKAISGVKTVSAESTKPFVCPGESSTLNASSAGTGISITYKWASNPPGTTGSGASITVNPTTTTTYTVSITDCNTILTATTKVTVNPVPDPSIFTGPQTICSGNNTTLTASATLGNQYKWYSAPPAGTLLHTGATYVTPVLTSTTTYYVEATSAAGCTNTAKTPVTVTINENPVDAVVTGNKTICAGTQTTLTVISPPGTYKWFDVLTGGNLLHTGSSFTTPVLTSTTTFYVEVESPDKCKSVERTPVTVTVNTLPVSPVVAVPDSICKNRPATLTATAPGGTYRWYDVPTGGNPLFTGPAFITPILASTTTYYVEVESAATCTSAARTPVTVKVSDMKASFTANPTIGLAPLKVDFTNTSHAAFSYLWDFGDKSDFSKQFSPSHIYSKKGDGASFEVKLTVTNTFGCTDVATMIIMVEPFSKLIVPNVFTPNQDNINDQFRVESIGLNFVNAQLFNRWGLKMYEWNTIHEGWDGRTASGVEAPPGTYYYLIVAKGMDGKNYEFRGHFTLLR